MSLRLNQNQNKKRLLTSGVFFASTKGEGRGPTECVDAQATEVNCAPLKYRPIFPVIADHTHESILNGALASTGFSRW